MFSQLGPLFKTTLRQAERVDARLEIRREEKDTPNKKHDFEKDDESGGGLWEDSTSVSIEALRNFLIGFLQSRGEDPPGIKSSAPAAPAAAHEGAAPQAQPAPPANAKAARAAQAYSAQAAHAAPPPLPPPPEKDDTASSSESPVNLADLLAADELRTMHALIHELDMLARRGVQMLTIEKAESFLQALVAAVELEKSRF